MRLVGGWYMLRHHPVAKHDYDILWLFWIHWSSGLQFHADEINRHKLCSKHHQPARYIVCIYIYSLWTKNFENWQLERWGTPRQAETLLWDHGFSGHRPKIGDMCGLFWPLFYITLNYITIHHHISPHFGLTGHPTTSRRARKIQEAASPISSSMISCWETCWPNPSLVLNGLGFTPRCWWTSGNKDT